MPRRKAENGTASATVGTTKPRARRSKKDVNAGSLEPKMEMVQGIYDSQTPSGMQNVPMMHNHNGMMPQMHEDGGPMSSHHVYTPPNASMGAPPPPDYYQAMPPGYQAAPPLGPPSGPAQQPHHQFIEPEPPQSPYVGQNSHLQQHNHMIMRLLLSSVSP